VNYKWNQYNFVLNLNENILKHEILETSLCQMTELLVRNDGIYFVKPSINERIKSETNITVYQTYLKLLRNVKLLWNLDAPNVLISYTKWCAYFVKPSINEWILRETDITSYQNSMKLLSNMKCMWNLDAPNGRISRTKRCT
jgi:hypothetical protein